VNNGEFVFDGDFGPAPEKGLEWPPFRTFGREYYTYQLLLDLKVGKEWAARTEPHPRCYTDTTFRLTDPCRNYTSNWCRLLSAMPLHRTSPMCCAGCGAGWRH
jgi:hypothetical protein